MTDLSTSQVVRFGVLSMLLGACKPPGSSSPQSPGRSETDFSCDERRDGFACLVLDGEPVPIATTVIAFDYYDDSRAAVRFVLDEGVDCIGIEGDEIEDYECYEYVSLADSVDRDDAKKSFGRLLCYEDDNWQKSQGNSAVRSIDSNPYGGYGRHAMGWATWYDFSVRGDRAIEADEVDYIDERISTGLWKYRDYEGAVIYSSAEASVRTGGTLWLHDATSQGATVDLEFDGLAGRLEALSCDDLTR